jgi:Fe-S-cluster-containing dehydrogenase component
MNDAEYTVVNRFDIPTPGGKPVHAKFQCMHCQKAACVSACIVGALTKDPTGAVRYDAWKCIGCRYCMQACPFQVPAYEYTNALTPQVRKCTFCHDARLTKEQPPACVESCPMEVMTFGPRSQVLAIARERMKAHPTRYTPHIYGENEVGGTSWLYLAAIPFEQLGFPKLGFAPTPGYTEPIQHAIFKWFLPPVALFATLGGVWKYMSTHHSAEPDAQEHPKP